MNVGFCERCGARVLFLAAADYTPVIANAEPEPGGEVFILSDGFRCIVASQDEWDAMQRRFAPFGADGLVQPRYRLHSSTCGVK